MDAEAAQFGREVRERVGQGLAGIELGVSRETWLERVECYAGRLTVWGRRHNLVAAAGDPAALAFHIIDCLTPAALPVARFLLEGGVKMLDLGSGAGLPGLLLAAAGAARVTLLESRRKRVSFLKVVSLELGLGNVAIDGRYRSVAELEGGYDAVVGRAFAKPAVFFEAARAALKPGGRAVLYAGARPFERGGIARAEEIEEVSYVVRTGAAERLRRLVIWRARQL